MNVAIAWKCEACGSNNVARLGRDVHRTEDEIESVAARTISQLRANHYDLSPRCRG